MSVKEVWFPKNSKKNMNGDFPLVVHIPLEAASSASLYKPRKKKTQARKTQTCAGHSGFSVRNLYSCKTQMMWVKNQQSWLQLCVVH